jgi:hypothetical protein
MKFTITEKVFFLCLSLLIIGCISALAIVNHKIHKPHSYLVIVHNPLNQF